MSTAAIGGIKRKLAEAQRITPALAFSDEEPPTKPGGFKVSSKALSILKKEMGWQPDQTLFAKARKLVSEIDYNDLPKAFGERSMDKAQDVLARAPRRAFEMWLRKIHLVSPRLGRYLREVPENASLLFYTYIVRVSGRDMADIILKRYFATASDHPGSVVREWVDSVDLEEAALDGRAMIAISNTQEGDFRSGAYGGGVLPGELSIRVYGNTFPIKDELKKLGLRGERVPGAERDTWQWKMFAYRGSGRPPKGAVPEATVRAVIPKVQAVVDRHNEAMKAKNLDTLDRMGLVSPKGKRPLDPASIVKDFDRHDREAKRAKSYGIETKIDFGRMGADHGTVRVRGNTFPIKEVLKKHAFRFERDHWTIPYAEYAAIRQKFWASAFKVLKDTKGEPAKAPGDTTASIKQRLAVFKRDRREGYHHEGLEEAKPGMKTWTVSGRDTYAYREVLKADGYTFDKATKTWKTKVLPSVTEKQLRADVEKLAKKRGLYLSASDLEWTSDDRHESGDAEADDRSESGTLLEASASRWFVKADIDGVSGYRPKKLSLRHRFSVVRGPGGWAVDDAKTRDSASFRALDEVAAWIESVAGEKVEWAVNESSGHVGPKPGKSPREVAIDSVYDLVRGMGLTKTSRKSDWDTAIANGEKLVEKWLSTQEAKALGARAKAVGMSTMEKAVTNALRGLPLDKW